MSFFDNIRSRIFPDPSAIESGKMPVLAEPIRRSDKFRQSCELWKLSGKREELVFLLKNEYHGITGGGSEVVTRLKGQGIQGFLVHGSEAGMDQQDAQYLLDSWAEGMQELPYRLYSSHHENYIRDNKVLVKERYYFKPVIQSYQPPVPQEYGNVLFESETYDGELLSVKCMVTWYTGFNYESRKPFGELVEQLVG